MRPKINQDQIKKKFQYETGVDAIEVEEITEAFPASNLAHIYTETRTFNFVLTPGGRAKKGSFEEEK